MMAAKKWSDNGTTGFKWSDADISKQCDVMQSRLDKATRKRDEHRDRYLYNQHRIDCLLQDRTYIQHRIKKHKSYDKPLYAKWVKACKKYFDARQESAYLLHRVVRDMEIPAPFDDLSVDESDTTQPMSPLTDDEGHASPDYTM